jgi:hypothetical protein
LAAIEKQPPEHRDDRHTRLALFSRLIEEILDTLRRDFCPGVGAVTQEKLRLVGIRGVAIFAMLVMPAMLAAGCVSPAQLVLNVTSQGCSCQVSQLGFFLLHEGEPCALASATGSGQGERVLEHYGEATGLVALVVAYSGRYPSCVSSDAGFSDGGFFDMDIPDSTPSWDWPTVAPDFRQDFRKDTRATRDSDIRSDGLPDTDRQVTSCLCCYALRRIDPDKPETQLELRASAGCTVPEAALAAVGVPTIKMPPPLCQ